ncbi:MAG: Xaa-Pro aminopeptidase [Thermoanaerobaculia bacterium]|nr:Xaa-Pro aminopeptidase [Thermoanaerobaculia bacterium]
MKNEASTLPSSLLERRNRLFDRIGDGLALLFSAPEASFGHDVHYRYRPDPDLFYLTGFSEPETVAVFDGKKRELTMFVRPRNRDRETWEGYRAGPKGAIRSFAADHAHERGDLERKLPELLRKTSRLYYSFGLYPEGDTFVIDCLARFRREARNPDRGPLEVLDLSSVVSEMRLFKTAEEVELMRRSAAITAAAHVDAMRAARPGMKEFELEAVLMRRFLSEGASGYSYPPIVASGANSTILHYIENRREMRDGELLLIDAGSEFQGYAADITRTFPVSGRFSEPQRLLYQVVLLAQKAAIAAVKPGARFDTIQETAHDILIEGLLSAGLLKGKAAAIKKKNLQQRFTLHRTSHWLGLDVHDRGRYHAAKGEPLVLAPGMVLTVEPGLYVRLDEKKASPLFLGIGIRIEDDVLVTEDGNEVLTRDCPKEIEELEGIVGKAAAAPRKGRAR